MAESGENAGMAVMFESCVDSLEAATISAARGAGRLEVCANLDDGGTTPHPDLVSAIVRAVSIPVYAMVRPRAGSFVYDAHEAFEMERDVRLLSAVGASGIVMGALNPSGHIDVDLMERLIGAARPLPVTFHRVIDSVPSLTSGLESLIALGVDRVLTSGGQATAEDGAQTIAALVRQSRGRIVVIAGGGVRAHNVANLVRATGVTEVHARLLTAANDPSTWPERVRSFVAALGSLS